MPTLSAPPDPSAVARFGRDWSRLTDYAGGPVGIAVSGGADSLALLLLANAAFPHPVYAATVDHGLRATSADEAAFVRALCAGVGVAHTILPATLPGRGNRSAAAREARYALLEAWADEVGLSWLATGHHADDQLETILMRMNRGSGVAGLAGIRARHGRVVRPLLGWRRFELEAVVAHCGLTPVDDPSNRDDRYDRARMRRALTTVDWLDRQTAVKSATLLAEADAALDWAAAQVPLTTNGAAIIVAAENMGLPAEIVRRVVLRAIHRLDPLCRPRGEALERLTDTLRHGGTAMIGGVRCAATPDGWRFTRAASRRPIP